jgi:ABC-type microcin C transport system duplicated ATPase subunit YejF
VNLQATDITKSYSVGIRPRCRHLRVLNGASVELDRGEVVGLVGENGSRDEVYDLLSFRSLGPLGDVGLSALWATGPSRFLPHTSES